MFHDSTLKPYNLVFFSMKQFFENFKTFITDLSQFLHFEILQKTGLNYVKKHLNNPIQKNSKENRLKKKGREKTISASKLTSAYGLSPNFG